LDLKKGNLGGQIGGGVFFRYRLPKLFKSVAGLEDSVASESMTEELPEIRSKK